MSKVVFFALPYTGHMNASLPFIRELAARGEEVICYSGEAYADQIAAANAQLRVYDAPNLKGAPPTRLMELANKVVEVADHVLEKELPNVRSENPDYIIYDSVAAWGHYISRILGIPAVRSNAIFALNRPVMRIALKEHGLWRIVPMLWHGLRERRQAKRKLRAIRERYNLPDLRLLDGLVLQDDLNIVHYSRDFHPCADTFGDNYHFVGSSITERAEAADSFPWQRLTKEPVVYISLGTVYTEQEEFFRTCFRAFEDFEGQIVLAAGGKTESDFPAAPANFVIVPFAPQLSVLRRAAAFVSHAGTSGMAEATSLGVPLALYPQNGEQMITAAHLTAQGAAILLRGKVTPTRLRKAVETALSDPEFRRNSARIGESLRSAGGAKRAVDEIFRWKAQLAAAA